MARQRIYSDRIYIVSVPQGKFNDGSYRPHKVGLVTGRKLRSDRASLFTVPAPAPISSAKFRLENGRVPEHQPVVGIDGATDFLKENPFSVAYFE